ncbi:hypothetical protein M441DRAFT_61920 [Trichoderma asperellum CBS 433.97]|uniref:Uncharacterized protein n=1 Tax=Trichoderma asperellum (strain ATCC 204424 / CBS 433.97 / NBRC 101777) TaxID=1042311 RepID=A0A2T3YV80_TRIA4|nr:hypothetical protein M441DRAFT_61920 [Trichoderma asperellum CBS 433.97]PTB36444.1 hypothetical protein M441DRAFT_61920 [Trichoderma asperellum CBS 433.97]
MTSPTFAHAIGVSFHWLLLLGPAIYATSFLEILPSPLISFIGYAAKKRDSRGASFLMMQQQIEAPKTWA